MKKANPDSIERISPFQAGESSGHTMNLRKRLKIAREDRGLSQEDVAHRIAQRLGKTRHDKSNIGKYEQNKRQPPIDVMAAWARAVGFRLHVDLVEHGGNRSFVLVSDDLAEVVAKLDSADIETRSLALATLRRLLRLDD